MLTMVDATWWDTIESLLNRGLRVAPSNPAGATRELLAVQTAIRMSKPVLTNSVRRLGYRFMCAEAAWILGGDNRVETIAPYSKHITSFSDDGLTFQGAYGPPFRDQLPYVANDLQRDMESRRAVATIWRPRPGASKDIPCTVALQWLCRNEELHCMATMRSSDIWLGWPYDVFNFSMMSAYLLLYLRTMRLDNRYWRNIDLGYLWLIAGSQHLYVRNAGDAYEVVKQKNRWPLFEYEPIKLDEFKGPEELTRHLWSTADLTASTAQSTFLQEMIVHRKGERA